LLRVLGPKKLPVFLQTLSTPIFSAQIFITIFEQLLLKPDPYKSGCMTYKQNVGRKFNNNKSFTYLHYVHVPTNFFTHVFSPLLYLLYQKFHTL